MAFRVASPRGDTAWTGVPGGAERGDAVPVSHGAARPAVPPPPRGQLIKKVARHSWCLLPAPRAEKAPEINISN